MKVKILIAEDDLDDQHFFHEFLKGRTDILLMPIAENGEVLIEMLDKIKKASELPDLIILDQNMPKRNGIQTLELLKMHTIYSQIPVSIYSTYTDEFLLKTGLEKGACKVVSKPITREEYGNMINNLLETCL